MCACVCVRVCALICASECVRESECVRVWCVSMHVCACVRAFEGVYVRIPVLVCVCVRLNIRLYKSMWCV